MVAVLPSTEAVRVAVPVATGVAEPEAPVAPTVRTAVLLELHEMVRLVSVEPSVPLTSAGIVFAAPTMAMPLSAGSVIEATATGVGGGVDDPPPPPPPPQPASANAVRLAAKPPRIQRGRRFEYISIPFRAGLATGKRRLHPRPWRRLTDTLCVLQPRCRDAFHESVGFHRSLSASLARFSGLTRYCSTVLRPVSISTLAVMPGMIGSTWPVGVVSAFDVVRTSTR